MKAFPRLRMQRSLLDVVGKKPTKFSKNEKNELFNNHWVNACFESNIIDVSSDTWWLDNGATIHACNSMQAMISRRIPTNFKQYVYMRDSIRFQVDFLGVVKLQLSIGIFLELQDVGYIPYKEKFDISTYFG